MRTIVVGAGFLGMAFKEKGHLVWDRNQFKPETDLKRLDEFDVVINCIGKSDTQWCEDNFQDAFYSNALIVRAMSTYCKTKDIKFVHVSTGCLYDKLDEPSTETDPIAARNNYLVTKWSGEQFCHKGDLILRSGLLFGQEKVENNLLCKILEFNSYTSTDVFVDAALALIWAGQNGIFNVACDGSATMCLNKLKNYYKPPKLRSEIERCYGEIQSNRP